MKERSQAHFTRCNKGRRKNRDQAYCITHITILLLDCFPNNRGAGTAAAMQGVGNALIASIAVPLLSAQPSYLTLGQLTLVGIALILWWRIPTLEKLKDTELSN